MDDATIFTVLSTQADWDVEKGTALLVKVQDFNQTAFRTKALAAAKKEKMLSNRVEVEKQIEQLFADMDVAQLRKILEDAEGDPDIAVQAILEKRRTLVFAGDEEKAGAMPPAAMKQQDWNVAELLSRCALLDEQDVRRIVSAQDQLFEAAKECFQLNEQRKIEIVANSKAADKQSSAAALPEATVATAFVAQLDQAAISDISKQAEGFLEWSQQQPDSSAQQLALAIGQVLISNQELVVCASMPLV